MLLCVTGREGKRERGREKLGRSKTEHIKVNRMNIMMYILVAC
jgi:hypothetical protein